jgi:hypothetical protein
MTSVDISVILSADGDLELRSWRNDARWSADVRVDLSGLDGRLLRLFERWMTLRDRTWEEEEIRVFGQLLHRMLFPSDSWSWVERQAAKRDGDVVRLMLAFPADAASSRLAAVPWEYLCTQDRPGNDGSFLVLTPWLLLSRVVPSGVLEETEPPGEQVRILPVVGEASNPRLGAVSYQPVLEAIQRTTSRPGFSTLDPLLDATEDRLAATVAEHHPHVVHYVGHGRFREGRGAVALRNAQGDTTWLPEDRLARALCSGGWGPAIVILHACEGGAIDYEYRFAGLAPTIVRRGALCVVAMQYAVTNATAITFSEALYAALADHQSLDEALQTARRRLYDTTKDPRLLGVPTIYQRSAEPLLVSSGSDR